MENIIDFLGNVSTLSSEGLVGEIFGFLATAGDWAGAVSNLLGLL